MVGPASDNEKGLKATHPALHNWDDSASDSPGWYRSQLITKRPYPEVNEDSMAHDGTHMQLSFFFYGQCTARFHPVYSSAMMTIARNIEKQP